MDNKILVKPLCIPINLKRLSTISVAISFWEDPEIKRDVKKYFLKDFDESKVDLYGEKWTRIWKKNLKRVDDFDLPLELVLDIRDIVFLVGEKLHWWSVHVIAESDLNIKYIKKCFWTPYGTVDEVKVLQSWLEDPEFAGFIYKLVGDRSILFGMACHYAQEEFLSANLKEAAEIIEFLYLPKALNLKLHKLHTIMALFVCYMVGDGLPNRALELYKNLKGSTYTNAADKLFVLCVEFNMKEAADYFFKKLKDCDKQKILEEISTKFLKSNSNERSGYKIEKLPDMLIYLINNMANGQRYEFLKKNAGRCFQIFVKTWPYQELCLPLLNFVWYDLKTSKQGIILNSVINVLIKDFKNSEVNKKTLQQILKNLLNISSEKLKISKFVKEKQIIFDLFKASEFETIKIILSDDDLATRKMKVTDISDYLVDYLTNNGTFASIDNYLEQIDFTEDEKQLFKSKCDFLVDFSFAGADAGLLNQFLSWKFSFADESTATRLRLAYMKKLSDSGQVDVLFMPNPGQVRFRNY